MTFVQKYLVTPALGAAGLFVGYTVYRRKYLSPERAGDPAEPATLAASPGEAANEELRRLAARVEDLSARLAKVELGRTGQDWLELLNERFVSLEERMTVQAERITAIEGSYQNIETSLEAILKSLGGPRPQPAGEPEPVPSAV